MTLKQAIDKAMQDAQSAGHAHEVYLVRDTDGDFVVAHAFDNMCQHTYVWIGTAYPDQTIGRIQRYDAKTNSFIDETPANNVPIPGKFYYRES